MSRWSSSCRTKKHGKSYFGYKVSPNADKRYKLVRKIKGRPVKVEVDCPPDLVLDSSPGALSQIVTNMVMNSLLHGFERDQPGRIAIRAALDGEQVVFEYADDGVGMDRETLGKLFDPFFTTKRGTGGSGLGAHILYNLVTGALGGTVKAESEPGEGLRYQLKFPRSLKK